MSLGEEDKGDMTALRESCQLKKKKSKILLWSETKGQLHKGDKLSKIMSFIKTYRGKDVIFEGGILHLVLTTK